MANSLSEQPQSTNSKKSGKTWFFLIPSFFSILVGFFPSIMPDSIKTKLGLLLGNNYETIWTVVFIFISILLMWFSYSLWKTDNKSKIGTSVAGVKSGGKIELNSQRSGDFSAEDLESGKDISLKVNHNGEVDIKGTKSEGDTTIDIKSTE